MKPDLSLEHALPGRIAGLDEVGRGPLAGPVVAAAVILPARMPAGLAVLLDDSKKLTHARRLVAFAALHESDAIIAVGAASVAEIDLMNILQASLLAMRRACARLASPPDGALVDGNRDPKLACPTVCVIGGDGKSLSIAAASIVAKIIRDRAMTRLDGRYPGFGWASNAGYGSQAHLRGLQALGPTPHHRRSFAPVRTVLSQLP